MTDAEYLKQAAEAKKTSDAWAQHLKHASGEKPDVEPENTCHRSMRVSPLPDPMGGIPGPWGSIGD